MIMEDVNVKFAPKNNEEENKPKLGLLPFDVLEQDAIAYEYGVYKYDQYSWTEGFITSELISSAMRHIKAYFWDGEIYDKEAMEKGFKMHHLASARFCLASILHAEIEGIGKDDRPCHKLKKVFQEKLNNRRQKEGIKCPFCGFCHKGDDLQMCPNGEPYVNICKKCKHNFHDKGGKNDETNAI